MVGLSDKRLLDLKKMGSHNYGKYVYYEKDLKELSAFDTDTSKEDKE